jgi:hypothetical protein
MGWQACKTPRSHGTCRSYSAILAIYKRQTRPVGSSQRHRTWLYSVYFWERMRVCALGPFPCLGRVYNFTRSFLPSAALLAIVVGGCRVVVHGPHEFWKLPQVNPSPSCDYKRSTAISEQYDIDTFLSCCRGRKNRILPRTIVTVSLPALEGILSNSTPYKIFFPLRVDRHCNASQFGGKLTGDLEHAAIHATDSCAIPGDG